MQDYIKRVLLKRIILTMIAKGETNWEELKTATGINEEDMLTLVPMIQRFYEELQTESGFQYRANEAACSLVSISDEFWYNLPGFSSARIMEREEEILTKGDPLLFITQTIGTLHKGDRELVALNVLIGLTPWMNTDTLHIYPVGKSGKGKSDLCATVLLAFPEHSYEMVTSSSPMSIFYAYGMGALQQNKIIFFDDIKFNPGFIDVIKAFSAATKVRPRHWTVDIHRKFLDIKPKDSYSIWLTSVSPLRDIQLKNRFLMANVDESFRQDQRVWQHIDKMYRMALEKKIVQANDFETCRNLINIIIQEPHDVIIPYRIKFPVVYDRRAYLFFLVMIKTITFCYKFQRKKLGNFIISTRTDFEIAKRIYKKIEEFQTSKASLQAVNILKILPESIEDQMNHAMIAEQLHISTREVQNGCRTLVESGLANAEKVGGRWVYWKPSNPGVDLVTQELSSLEVSEQDLKDDKLPTELKDYINTINASEVMKYFEKVEEEDEAEE